MKTKLEQLAVFGGQPAFDEMLHVGRPNIGDKQVFLDRVSKILDRRWLTNDGPCVREFEKRIADYTDVRHCVAVCNGTIALELATRALRMKDEVIVPSFTFIATAHALQWQRVKPVFCDIDPVTQNIDPSRVEELITDRTTGIIGVHVWGRPCAVEELSEIAKRHNLHILFDAAHAFGCCHRGKMIGGFGEAETFSFHATKFLNALEGGAVCTNNDDLAEKVRLMRNFGFGDYDKVIYPGTNGKMQEVSAAMGLTLLDGIDQLIEKNRTNYRLYQEELSQVPGVHQVLYDESARCNYQYIVLEIEDETSPIDRDHLMQVLHEENVFARRYFYPGCHQMEPYRSSSDYKGLQLPNTDRLGCRVLVLPTGTAMREDDIQKVCAIIRLTMSCQDRVRERIDAEGGLAARKEIRGVE